MKQIVYPTKLQPGSKIAVTAFSAGVDASCHSRLEGVLTSLHNQGFEVIEGQCLRENTLHVSASKEERATELMAFLCDDSIDAIAPPWGGDFTMELLPLLDFERLKTAKPKWLFGFSDVSTLATCLTNRLGWSTAHCANLMQLHSRESEPLTQQTSQHLQRAQFGYDFVQHSSEHYQLHGESFAQNPNTTLNLTEATQWKAVAKQSNIQMAGRLIGGCLDTLQYLIGTPYFDWEALKQRYIDDGIILYLENAELLPTALKRALLSLKLKGVLSQVNGLLIGRNAVSEASAQGLSGEQALLDVIAELPIPVIYDVDIGHLPPNLTLFNGAYAQVEFYEGAGKIRQILR